MISGQGKDFFEITYVYYAQPRLGSVKLKNTINLRKDMFELNGNYDANYWEKNEVLPLTQEMQDFIDKVNSSTKKSGFKTKTNLN